MAEQRGLVGHGSKYFAIFILVILGQDNRHLAWSLKFSFIENFGKDQNATFNAEHILFVHDRAELLTHFTTLANSVAWLLRIYLIQIKHI